jgi:DNA-binding winged helix-turn-helix (wHTH) protein/CheY-like chemotaxis protein
MNLVASDRVWRFGDVVFDDAEGRLLVSGQRVEIDRNCRAILVTMLRNAGAEVSKEQLLQAGWPNRIVHENSLAKAIGRLRQALGDQGQALETVYGHGYKLNVALRPEEPSLVVAAPAEAAPAAGPRTPRAGRRPVAVLAGGAALVLAVVGGAFVLGQPSDPAAVPFREVPPVTGDAPDTVGRVLWVDDHPQNNIYEKRFFENHRIAVHNVVGSADALRLLAMYDYEVVNTDMGRGEDRLAGLKLAGQMRARGDRTPLLIYTVRPDGAEAQRAQREMIADAGAQGVVLTPEEVRSVILKLFGNPAARPPS